MAKGMKNNTSKVHYTKPHIKEWESVHDSCRQYEFKLSRICIRHIRLKHGHLMSRNNQQHAEMQAVETRD